MRTLLATALLAVLAAHAPASPCGDGRYLVLAGSDVLRATPDGPRPALVIAASRLSVESGCAPAFSRVRATRVGTLVTAAFPRCGGARVLRLAARFTDDCTAIYGRLRARRVGTVRFAAGQSSCGDGVVDTGGGEECDPNDLPCTNGASCSLIGCRCDAPPPG